MPKSETTPESKPLKYPDLVVNGIKVEPEDTKITFAQAKQILGVETEEQYAVRRKKEKPGLKESAYRFDDDKLPVHKDVEGRRFVCWHNNRNRPLDLKATMSYAQEVLYRRWAGPLVMPGETVNGETVIVSRSGEVQSGQKRLIGLIFAVQLWEKDKAKWEGLWDEEPFLETLAVFGTSDSPKIIATLDNVCPRTLADTIYTTEVFKRHSNGKEMTLAQRREHSKMLDDAVDLLWKRTQAGDVPGQSHVFQTHGASLMFKENHPKLVACVKEVFRLNSEENGRGLSKLRLNPGHMATVLYLAGSSDSDPDTYRHANPPTEKQLNWDRWEQALDFVTQLSTRKKGGEYGGKLPAVVEAVKRLDDPSSIKKAPAAVIEEVLAKAWRAFVERNGKVSKEDDLTVKTQTKSTGEVVPVLESVFGGVDAGARPSKEDDDSDASDEEEDKKAVEDAKKRKAVDELKARIAARKAAPKNGDKAADNGKPRLPTRKELQEANTRKAAKADAEMAAEAEEEPEESEEE